MPTLRIYIPDLKNGGGEQLLTKMLKSNVIKNYFDIIEVISTENFNEQHIDCYIVKNWKVSFLFDFIFRKDDGAVNIIYFSGPIFLFALSFVSRKVYLYEHGDPFLISKLRTNWIRRFLYRRAILKARKLFVVNSVVRQKVLRSLSIPSEKVLVIENPINPITDHDGFFYDTELPTTKSALIIGRDSPEKRLRDGMEYLQSQKYFDDIFIISDTRRSYSSATVFKNYDSLADNKINVANFILFNFSYCETFSLVIGEWLAARGVVYSVYCPVLSSIWGDIEGFNTFDEHQNLPKINHGSPSSIFEYTSVAEYTRGICEEVLGE